MAINIEERCDELFALGLKFNGEGYAYSDDTCLVSFHNLDIQCYDEAKWEREINNAKRGLESRGIKKFGEEYDKDAYIETKRLEQVAWEKENSSWLQPERIDQDKAVQ